MTGSRRYSADLPQGGLEIPCKFIFTGISKDIEKVKKLIKFATRDGKLSIITTESPSSSITVAESSGTTVDIAQSPSTSITVAESSSTTVDSAQSQSQLRSLLVQLLTLLSLPAHQSQLRSTTVDVAQSPCALIKVTKSPGTTVKVPSSSTKVTESSVPLLTISKPASSFDVVDSSIKIENTQLLGSHCKRLKSQTNQQGKKVKRVMPSDEELGRIVRGDDLTDYSINCAFKMFKQQFTKVKGLHLTLYQRKKHSDKFLQDHIEIIHSRNSGYNHDV